MPSSGKKPVRQHLPSHPERSSGLTAGKRPVPRLPRAFRGAVGMPGGSTGVLQVAGGRTEVPAEQGDGLRSGSAWVWGVGERVGPGGPTREPSRDRECLRKLGHHSGTGQDGTAEPRGQWALRSRRLQEPGLKDFPGGPVVNNRPSSAGDVGSIPGGGNKFPHAAGQLLSALRSKRSLRYSGDQQSQKRKTGAGCWPCGRWGRQGPRATPGSRAGAARGSVLHSVSRAHHCQQAPQSSVAQRAVCDCLSGPVDWRGSTGRFSPGLTRQRAVRLCQAGEVTWNEASSTEVAGSWTGWGASPHTASSQHSPRRTQAGSQHPPPSRRCLVSEGDGVILPGLKPRSRHYPSGRSQRVRRGRWLRGVVS